MSGAWASSRQPASFRGVPFVMLESNLRRGRQVALHVYPFRDDPWPEDLGRSPRLSSFRGFVVGDDADEQMRALMAAVEQPGPGELVHPAIGPFTVQVLSFACNDAVDRGRVWGFEMTVVPAKERVYPAATADTQGAAGGLFGEFGAAVAKDFAAVQGFVSDVRSQVTGVVQTVQGYAAQATGLVRDATSLARLPSNLLGNFGRFSAGSLGVNLVGRATGVLTTAARVTGTVNGAFNAVDRISGTLSTLASRL